MSISTKSSHTNLTFSLLTSWRLFESPKINTSLVLFHFNFIQNKISKIDFSFKMIELLFNLLIIYIISHSDFNNSFINFPSSLHQIWLRNKQKFQQSCFALNLKTTVKMISAFNLFIYLWIQSQQKGLFTSLLVEMSHQKFLLVFLPFREALKSKIHYCLNVCSERRLLHH